MTPPIAHRPHRTANRIWLGVYLVTICVVVVGVLVLRDWTLREMSTPEARAEWNAWRESEPNQSKTGPVIRKPPVVTEPPALLLMRDHFTVVMSAALIFGSLLFGTLMIAVRGVFAGGREAEQAGQATGRADRSHLNGDGRDLRAEP